VFTDPLPSNRRPIVARVCLSGTVFTELLPSNGHTRRSIVCILINVPVSVSGSIQRRWEQFFLIGIVGGGVQLGPLGTAASNRPIMPAPGDYDDGEIGGMIGRGNRSTRRKPTPMPLCPPQTPHAAQTRNWATAVGSQRLTA
jgi:hypothetical protein